jgi:hypothetical protein
VEIGCLVLSHHVEENVDFGQIGTPEVLSLNCGQKATPLRKCSKK